MESTTDEAGDSSQLYQTNVSHELSPNKEMKDVWQLFKEAFALYRLKFKSAIGIMIIPVLLIMAVGLIGLNPFSSLALSQSPWVSAIKIVLYILSLYFTTISVSALFLSVKEDVGAREAYRRAIKISPSFILVAILSFSVVAGGFMLFVIPGIFFLVWFSLAEIVNVFEGQRGFKALYRSKQLVSGNFWSVLWRLIFMMMILVIVTIPFSLIGDIFANGSYEFIPVGIARLFSAPLWAFLLILLYRDLAQMKQAQAPSESRIFFKLLCYLAGIIGVLLLFGSMILRGAIFFDNDIPNPDDSDLQLSAIDIPADQNSYYAFQEAKSEIYWPQDADISKETDDALENEILQKNEQALASFEKGISLFVFQEPGYQNPENVTSDQAVESLEYLRNLAKINSLKATSLLKQGRDKEAFDQALKTIKMGQMLEDEQGDLVHYLIGIAIKQTGAENLKSLIANSHLSSSELLSYEKELDKYRDSRSAQQKAIKFEYIRNINTAEKEINENLLDTTGARSLYFYQPNKTKLLYMENYRVNVDNASKENYTQLVAPQEIQPIEWTDIFTDNCIGKMMFNTSAIYFTGMTAKAFGETYRIEEVQTLLALKAYEQDNGHMPDSLQDLVPEYLYELPVDPYDGKIIRYSPEKKIIYSVGMDLVDDGGNISGNNPKDLGSEIGW